MLHGCCSAGDWLAQMQIVMSSAELLLVGKQFGDCCSYSALHLINAVPVLTCNDGQMKSCITFYGLR